MPAVAIIPVLEYPDVPAAVKWLEEAFGFEVRLRIGSHRAQLQFESGAIVVSERNSPDAPLGSGHSLMVRVEGIEAHLSRARRHGAKIVGTSKTFPMASASTPASIRQVIPGRFPRRCETWTPPNGAASSRRSNPI
jgi:predicted enzyme related to lactoylglutathione lyase